MEDVSGVATKAVARAVVNTETEAREVETATKAVVERAAERAVARGVVAKAGATAVRTVEERVVVCRG
jgi:hypothetical protein